MSHQKIMNDISMETLNKIIIASGFQAHSIVQSRIINQPVNLSPFRQGFLHSSLTVFRVCQFSIYREGLSTSCDNLTKWSLVIYTISSHGNRYRPLLSKIQTYGPAKSFSTSGYGNNCIV